MNTSKEIVKYIKFEYDDLYFLKNSIGIHHGGIPI